MALDAFDTMPRLADGGRPLLGLRVFRVYPQDGTEKAGKVHGPKLIIMALRDYHGEGRLPLVAALAVLKTLGHGGKPAGTEPIWNLKRAQGYQPNVRKVTGASDPGGGYRAKRRGSPISSIRLPEGIRARLLLRGDEMGWVIRRDVDRLYDLIDDARAAMIFPAGTLEELAKAWTLAAPPPPQNQLRPQWFVPVLLDACRRLNNENAMKLASYAETWNPIEALAVQDAVERWEPEASQAEKLRSAGLQDEPPPEATEFERQTRQERAGRKIKA